MHGLHLTADLSGCTCPPARLTDAAGLLAQLHQAVAAVGLHAVGQLAHPFPPTPDGPGGVSACVLLAESHVCVHTWPEQAGVTLDIHVCHFSANRSAAAHALLQRLLAWFAPQQQRIQSLQRGPLANAPALVLAAGRGQRMRPLTDTCPKPLLSLHGRPLLQWQLDALVRAGCPRIAVNAGWLAGQIQDFLALYRSSLKQIQLSFSQHSTPPAAPAPVPELLLSNEDADFGHALETAGGIVRALPRLFPPAPEADEVFWVVAADAHLPDFAFSPQAAARFAASEALAHLWLVPNPPHHPRGDFGLSAEGLALDLPDSDTHTPRWTYSTVGLYRAALFAPPWCDIPPGNPQGAVAPLAPLLRRAMRAGRVSAEIHGGRWADVGTPERLAALNATAA